MFFRIIIDSWRVRSRSTIIEYGIIAALFAVAAIVTLTSMSDFLETMFPAVPLSGDGAVHG